MQEIETTREHPFYVEGWHTYYVSDSGVLVHNMCAVTVKVGSIKSESGIGSQQTPHQKALLDLAREAESVA